MNEELIESIKVTITNAEKLEVTDKKIADIINKLKIVLLNLRIQYAKISKVKEAAGILPIILELERNINKISSEIKETTSADNEELQEAIDVLNKYILENTNK
jgi:hypothetical protein